MSCEVIILQFIFYADCSPEEYFKANSHFSFPEPNECLYPSCRKPVPPNPHGYYSRNVITVRYQERILIRRYYCEYCGHTFSYLPSFCLPYYQYTVDVIFLGLLSYFFDILPFLLALMNLLNWQRQHVQFYRRRFKSNLTMIKLILRSLIPNILLPDEMDMKKGAQKVLSIVLTGFFTIQAFSTRFFAQCNNSFLAPCKLF